jgi:hypothetical protein
MVSVLTALQCGPIFSHPNIAFLKGLCWEVVSAMQEVLPVLIFSKVRCVMTFCQMLASKAAFLGKDRWRNPRWRLRRMGEQLLDSVLRIAKTQQRYSLNSP